MKPQKWILGLTAIAAGLNPRTTSMASAQNGAALSNIATPPTPPAGASASGLLPPLFVWNAQASSLARVGPWGNGSAQTTAGRTGTTLLVTTRNYEEGVRFDLNKPIDVTPYRQGGFWRVRVQISGAAQGGRGGGRGRTRTQTGTAAGSTAPLTQLRLKLVLDNGVMSGVLPINQAGGGGRWRGGGGAGQWQDLLLPVRNLSSSPAANGLLRRIILTGDSTASFSLDQVALVAETNSITAIVRRATDPAGIDVQTMTVKPGRSTTFVADVNGGTSDVNVTWNFNADNSAAFPPPIDPRAAAGEMGGGRGNARSMGGGIGTPGVMGGRGAMMGGMVAPAGNLGVPLRRIDAVGLTARPDWPNEEQDYRVEVTISDRAGRKPTVKKSILVQVRAGN